MKVRELAELLSAPFEGVGDLEITGAAALESASPSELSFAGDKAFEQARDSQAGCLIVSHRFPADIPTRGACLVRVKDPRATFAKALKYLYPQPAAVPSIHPTATVAPDALIDPSAEIGPYVEIAQRSQIGAGTRIAAGCFIGADVRIGAFCVVHPRVSLYAGVTIGDRVILHSGCVIGADGFGFVFTGGHYEKFPQIGSVTIGNDVEIGANSCVDRAALGVTSVGEGTKLDNLVHIGHNCKIGANVVIAAQTGISGGVVIEDGAVIGGQVGIGDKARIEANSIVGSGSGILTSKIVHAGEPVWGTPARPLRRYLQQLATIAKLPQMRSELLDLKRRMRDLEKPD